MKKYFKDIPNIEIGTLQYYNNRDVNERNDNHGR
jgi:hypothetical protein